MAKDTQKFVAPRGTQDVYGETVRKWQHLEKIARSLTERYHVQEMRTPVFEHTEVFARENDASDMVNKEMYTFMDRGERSLTLKPESTAGSVRAFVEHKLYATGGSLQRYFYIAPHFRYERPQKGRMRIFHQFGVEVFSAANPYVDMETMLIGLDFLNEVGIRDYKLVINTLGDRESQHAYREALSAHFKPYLPSLCSDCQRRYEQNPLRILDCKIDHDHEAIKTAPLNQDTLSEVSKTYFEALIQLLEKQNIPFEVDPRMVRGLDYYTHTVFEVISTDPQAGAQSTIFAGGRYSELVSYFGGPEIDAIGFGIGMERVLLYAELAGVDFDTEDRIDVYGMPRDEASVDAVFNTIQTLRHEGLRADMDYEIRSMKAQFKSLDRYHAKVAVICGADELAQGTLTLKNIATQEQLQVKEADAATQIKEWIGV